MARLNVLKTYKIYIGGKFPRSESGRYDVVKDSDGKQLANFCRSSRKDFRDAVTVARKAVDGWAGKSAYNKGQILYRIAEMLEGRKDQFVTELIQQGSSTKAAEKEVDLSIDRLVYYAGWSDKYQQVFGSVNPVASSHFNFSVPENMGVVTVIAPEDTSLIGLVSVIAPVIVGGNTCVVLASHSKPLCSITFAEVLNSSDVPGGVVNILTGRRKELISHFSTHMDVNAVVYCGNAMEAKKTIQINAALNVKRIICPKIQDWTKPEAEDPYLIMNLQETKTTWHPVGI
ncbi:MAG: aldehyde dehydrogenase family protein [Bacteroidia bacterium]|nr:aldehyde dehydrogenase family protein [Bacteroidia bacterium]